jgi:6-pyruvoyl-tetrahydropterin synthase
MNKLETLYLQLIKNGTDLLRHHPETLYNQSIIIQKLEALGVKTNAPSFSKAYNGKHLTDRTLKPIADGLKVLIKSELNYVFDEASCTFQSDIHDQTWQQVIVKLVNENTAADDLKTLHIYRDGRLPIPQKANFIQKAQQEVIIFGARLNQFTNYFTKRNDGEYANHVREALQKGVNFKCYLLHPEKNIAKLYFDDLAKAMPEEKKSIEVIRETIIELKKLREEFQSERYKGQLHLYQYNHIPNFYLHAIDAETPNGEMHISHYLYGLRRSNCPVLTFTKLAEPGLFKKYWDSFKAMTKNADYLPY